MQSMLSLTNGGILFLPKISHLRLFTISISLKPTAKNIDSPRDVSQIWYNDLHNESVTFLEHL